MNFVILMLGVNMKSFLIILLSSMLISSPALASQRLPKNWHDLYKSGEGWRILCDTPRTNGSLIYFKAEDKIPKADDVLMRFQYSHRMGRLLITPYKGNCTGGSVSIDGKKQFDLIGTLGHCTSAQGETFATPENNHKKRKSQPIGMFTNGAIVNILMLTKDGRKISSKIPLEGFKEAYSILESGEKCGVKGRRR